MSEIVTLSSDLEKKALREIFFESSAKKDFKDEAEREAFFWKYAGFYLTHQPELVFVARNPSVIGYCLGILDSNKVLELQPHLSVFTDVIKDYPAHFHINCHADARGQGLGGKLLKQFEKTLQLKACPGVHLITTVDARNHSFYHREGYISAHERTFDGKKLLLLGKKL